MTFIKTVLSRRLALVHIPWYDIIIMSSETVLTHYVCKTGDYIIIIFIIRQVHTSYENNSRRYDNNDDGDNSVLQVPIRFYNK